MGPAILLCPPSTTVQLLSYASPSKSTLKQRESSCVAMSTTVFFAGTFIKKPLSYSGKIYRRNNVDYPYTWNRVFASGEEVITVEEPIVNSSEAEQDEVERGEETTESSSIAVDPSTIEEVSVSEEPKTQARRNFIRNNNKALVVSNEELVPGAVFTGKVSAIQTFGAFVDLGAFTNGLVHISKLSKGFVKKVEDIVQIGQEVNVKIVDVDFTAKRISLMLMAEEGKEEEQQEEGKEGQNNLQRGSSSSSSSSSSPSSSSTPRRRSKAPATATKMKKGEIVTGIVKNMIRSGVFLTLPDGTDGYLPVGEVVFRGPNTSLENYYQTGQEITVRVLRIERGRVTLTTKQEVNYDKINEDLNKDVAERATNPFELAFRKNESISSYLAEKKKQKESNSEKEQVVDVINGTISKEIDEEQVVVEKLDTLNGVISEDVSEKESDVKEDTEASIEVIGSVDAVPEGKEEEDEKTDTLADKQEN